MKQPRCEGCGQFARDLFDNGGELPDGRYEALYLGRCCAAPASIRTDTPEEGQ